MRIRWRELQRSDLQQSNAIFLTTALSPVSSSQAGKYRPQLDREENYRGWITAEPLQRIC